MHDPSDSMRVALPSAPGGPETLGIARRPIPEPGPGEVLVRIRAAGVNRADCLQRAGRYPVPAGASDVLGLECAGEIVATGPGATHWRPGDAVCALLVGGGYAEFVAVPQAQCLPVPTGLSWEEAAALMETCCTVWSNLHLRAALQPGETLLVHGTDSSRRRLEFEIQTSCPTTWRPFAPGTIRCGSADSRSGCASQVRAAPVLASITQMRPASESATRKRPAPIHAIPFRNRASGTAAT